MKLNILHRTSEYRGDHAADVAVAVDQRSELVTELIERLGLRANDWVEIRIVPETSEDNFQEE